MWGKLVPMADGRIRIVMCCVSFFVQTSCITKTSDRRASKPPRYLCLGKMTMFFCAMLRVKDNENGRIPIAVL